jgi:3-dehydroquinate synthetase
MDCVIKSEGNEVQGCSSLDFSKVQNLTKKVKLPFYKHVTPTEKEKLEKVDHDRKSWNNNLNSITMNKNCY